MAILATVDTSFGESRELYIRLNSFDQLPNRQPDGTFSVPAVARFRGFVSQAAFQGGGGFMFEHLVEFTPPFAGDVRAEAYAALKAEPAFEDAADV
jgi:hypothetical protein